MYVCHLVNTFKHMYMKVKFPANTRSYKVNVLRRKIFAVIAVVHPTANVFP